MQTPLPLLPFASLQTSAEASSQIVCSLDTEMLHAIQAKLKSSLQWGFLLFLLMQGPPLVTQGIDHLHGTVAALNLQRLE